MFVLVSIDPCTPSGGRRPALPAGRPGSVDSMHIPEGGGPWGNHGFPHAK